MTHGKRPQAPHRWRDGHELRIVEPCEVCIEVDAVNPSAFGHPFRF
jgi:hypothetical protein